MIPFRHFGLALTALLAAVSFAEPAKAQGVLDFAKGLLGIPDEQPEIEYRERAPLVVPPKIQLREPQQPASARNPNWPKDPDVEAKRAAAEAAKRPAPETREHSNNPLLPLDEIRAGRRAGAGIPDGKPERNLMDAPVLSVQEMREIDARARSAQQSPVLAGTEPPRRFLTDPPAGYRKPAPGAPVAAPRTEGANRMLSDREIELGKTP